MDYILLTPGPTPIPPSVYAKMCEPILHHRTDGFGALFTAVVDGLRSVFRTKNEVLMLSCSGTGAMESSVANLLRPGDKTVILTTGVFGERYKFIHRRYGLDPLEIEHEWGRAADPARLEKTLKENPGIKAVYMQHTDTSTGTVNDLEALARVVRERSDALVVVDAVSGLGAEELETDAWGLDVVVSASQKGLMGPPGLAFMSVSDRAWKASESAGLPRFYFDWNLMRKSLPKKETPFTPAVTLVAAQAEALRLIQEEGIENIWKRTARLAAYTRSEVQKAGWRLFAKDPADNLTAVLLPDGVDGKKLIRDILNEDNISIAGGQKELEGKLVRLSHMGFQKKSDIDAGLKALTKRLSPTPA